MNNIRTRRRILGLTMKQLANIVGVTEAAISHYETGRREPDNDMLLRIANALGVTVDYRIRHHAGNVPGASPNAARRDLLAAIAEQRIGFSPRANGNLHRGCDGGCGFGCGYTGLRKP